MFEGNINLLSSYDSTDKVNASSIKSRKLTTGILKSQESKDYSLRLWEDYNTTLEDLNNEIKSFKSKIIVVGKPINYTGDTVFDFDYTGSEQTFIVPVSGTYKVELLGAQGGGSSFISGHEGCDTIKEESTENNIIHTGQSIHYSGLYFTNTLMIDGEEYRWTDKKEEQIGMPSRSDNSIIMGNLGNSYARITLVSID